MAEGFKTGGRTKGTPNKMTQEVRDAIAQVANDLGGPDRMVDWVKEDPANERLFWSSIYPKLLPLTLTGDKDNPLSMVHKIERAIIEPHTQD